MKSRDKFKEISFARIKYREKITGHKIKCAACKITFLQFELRPVEPGICRCSVPQFGSFLPPVAFVLYHQASASGKGSCHGEQNLVWLDSPEAMEMHPDCKSPFFVQSLNVTKPMEWILRQKVPPQTDTHPQSCLRVTGRWLTCWRGWGFPTCLGEKWGARPEIHPGCWQRAWKSLWAHSHRSGFVGGRVLSSSNLLLSTALGKFWHVSSEPSASHPTACWI